MEIARPDPSPNRFGELIRAEGSEAVCRNPTCGENGNDELVSKPPLRLGKRGHGRCEGALRLLDDYKYIKHPNKNRAENARLVLA